MNLDLELHSAETLSTEQQATYRFVLDADLVHVGGGSAVADY